MVESFLSNHKTATSVSGRPLPKNCHYPGNTAKPLTVIVLPSNKWSSSFCMQIGANSTYLRAHISDINQHGPWIGVKLKRVNCVQCIRIIVSRFIPEVTTQHGWGLMKGLCPIHPRQTPRSGSFTLLISFY